MKSGKFAAVAAACKRRLLTQFKKRLWKVKLLKVADTKDVSILVEQYEQSMHKDYVWAIFWSIMTRLYNQESTWDAFEQAKVFPLGAASPNWRALRVVLDKLYSAAAASGTSQSKPSKKGKVQSKLSKKVKVHGALYRHPKLRAFRASAKAEWTRIDLQQTTRAARDVICLQLLWTALPVDKVRAYQENPTRETFSAWYDEFMEKTNATIKGFGDYMMKVSLDPLVATGVCACDTLSRWPENCDGYKKYLAILYGRTGKTDTLGCLYHLHYSVSHEHGFNLSDAAAQLCWAKRRDNRALRD